jgi:Arc/MetJ family transcription regulator
MLTVLMWCYKCLNESELMRVTVVIDDALLESALQLSKPGIDKADLIREAVETYVRIKSAERLAGLGGAAPQISDVSRHRTES